MSKINIDIFDPATIAELRMRFQTCPRRITSEDYKYLIDVLSQMIDTLEIATEEIINNKNCYFGISASQNISEIAGSVHHLRLHPVPYNLFQIVLCYILPCIPPEFILTMIFYIIMFQVH